MSAKTIGAVKWIMMAGYPQLSGSNGTEKLTVRLTANDAGLRDNLPECGDKYMDSGDGYFSRYDGKFGLSDYAVVPIGGGLYEVTLTYEQGNGDGGGADNSVLKEEWEYDTQDTDIPIEQHSKYRYCWNHKLAGRTGQSASVPGWFERAKDETDADNITYRWFRADDKVTDGWKVIAKATKPGVESFRAGITTVQMIKRCGSKSRLERNASADYTVQRPKETFGRSGFWLRGGSKIRKAGTKWELTVSYLNSKYIDKDIYGS